MKWASAVTESLDLDTAIDQLNTDILSQLDQQKPDLLVVFVSGHYQSQYRNIAIRLRNKFDGCRLLGCSAGGVIGNGREIEQKPGLSVTAASLPNVTLAPFYLEMHNIPAANEDVQSWRDMFAIPDNEIPHFILLIDPFTFEPESLINGLDHCFPDSQKIGGLVSGARRSGEHALYLDDAVYRSGMVGLVMYGDIGVNTLVAQGCRPIGEPLFVTEVEKNRILSLDGKPPLMILRELYEQLDQRDRELLQHSLFLGITMQNAQSVYRQGDFLIRNIMGIESDSGVLAAAVFAQQNSVVQFHLRDAQTSADDLDALLQRFATLSATKPLSGSLLFSCLGRGIHLYDEPDHDSKMFQRHLGKVPLGGFFCNGEIGPVNGMTFLHGYTSAFALFSPK